MLLNLLSFPEHEPIAFINPIISLLKMLRDINTLS